MAGQQLRLFWADIRTRNSIFPIHVLALKPRARYVYGQICAQKLSSLKIFHGKGVKVSTVP